MSAASFAGTDLPFAAIWWKAHERAWAAIAAPGTWLTVNARRGRGGDPQGARLPLCARIKASLSPYSIGTAQECGNRPHSSRSKRPGRLTEKWSQSVLAAGAFRGRVRRDRRHRGDGHEYGHFAARSACRAAAARAKAGEPTR